MAMHIIIDGYNLIRQSKRWSLIDQQDIETGREALVDALAAYKKVKPHRITVVFDGATAPAYTAKRDRRKGIAIQFSSRDETADDVIKRLARRDREKALVVSSDQEILQSAESCGAAVINAAAFEAKLTQAFWSDKLTGADDDSDSWAPTTKKKGPSRRLPKRARKNRTKIAKL